MHFASSRRNGFDFHVDDVIFEKLLLGVHTQNICNFAFAKYNALFGEIEKVQIRGVHALKTSS